MGLFSKKSSSSKSNSLSSNDMSKKGSSTSVNSSIKSPTTPGKMSFTNGSPLETIPAIPLPPPPNPHADPVVYLRSLYAVRERTRYVMQAAQKQQLTNFTVDMSKWQETVDYVVSIIKRDYAPDYNTIPPHGRWQHFEVGGRKRVDQLLDTIRELPLHEKTKILIDLFLISVLLDAGAGTKWVYKSKDNGRYYKRSEGLAVASFEMFKDGKFSSDPISNPFRVDGAALKMLMPDVLANGLQITPQNPIDGLQGRAGLLRKLGQALDNQEFFGPDCRPGNMLDFLLNHPSTQLQDGKPYIPIPTLWTVLCDGLAPIWPQSRTQLDGSSLGDAWTCSTLPPGQFWERIVPFHKLTQWLTYSLMVPMTRLMQIQWVGEHLLTGLPEYRNGGLFIDTGLLTLKPQQVKRGLEAYHANSKKEGQPSVEVVPMFSAEDDVIVEWRALTVQFLDMLLPEVNNALGLHGQSAISLAQMLEAGTWKGGRELAEVSRPNTREPPIMILSDGTVF